MMQNVLQNHCEAYNMGKGDEQNLFSPGQKIESYKRFQTQEDEVLKFIKQQSQKQFFRYSVHSSESKKKHQKSNN